MHRRATGETKASARAPSKKLPTPSLSLDESLTPVVTVPTCKLACDWYRRKPSRRWICRPSRAPGKDLNRKVCKEKHTLVR